MSGLGRLAKVEALFAAVIEHPETDPEEILEGSGVEPEVVDEVRALLRADREAEGFLEDAVAAGLASLDEDRRDLWLGCELGSFRLTRRIGTGGMSRVYEGERIDEQVRQRVAVKLIRVGYDESARFRRRFRNERQILANLEHPGIARFLDGGETEDGRPFFVMELIEGDPLDVYCADLDLPARLDLFQKVCDAVSYAHGNLVVHRDLKPGNILVTAEGQPKLLDFGIAKLVRPDPGTTSRETTQHGLVMMTPAYASPEQVRGEPVTTATDIYSLGVVLYEILCGEKPYALEGGRPGRAEVIILEEEPEPPSVRAARSGDRRLARLLRGDLDTIALQALRKEPSRRYGTVAQLKGDLEAQRDGQPITARPNTLAYRLDRFARRHRWGIAAFAVALFLVGAWAVTAISAAARLARERDHAARVSEMLMDMFAIADPSEARGSTITGRELLDRGAARLSELEDQSETHATMADTLAGLYFRLGLYDRADALYHISLKSWRALGPGFADRAVESLNNLGNAQAARGDFEEAARTFAASLHARRGIYGEEHEEIALALNNLALVYHDLGDYDRAEPLYRESIAMDARLFGAGHANVAIGEGNLGLLLIDRARYEEASELLSGVLAKGEQEGPGRLFTLEKLALAYGAMGRRAEAEALIRETLAGRRAHHGEAHPLVARSMVRLAELLGDRGALTEAERLARDAIALRRDRLGDGHVETASAKAVLARISIDAGRAEEAVVLVEEAVVIYRDAYARNHPLQGVPLAILGEGLYHRGDRVAAAQALRAALAVMVTDDWRAVRARAVLGMCLADEGDPEGAMMIREAMPDLVRRLGEGHPRVLAARAKLEK